MSAFTFDWSQIAYLGSPLIVPWWAQVNMVVGFVFFYWLLTPILYYTNVSAHAFQSLFFAKKNPLRTSQTWFFAYLPISASSAFDRFGNAYDVTRVLDADRRLNETAYANYSQPYLSATFSVNYAIGFCLATSILVHIGIHYGPTILARLKNLRTEDEDVHMKLMRNYPEVPDWWYGLWLILFVALAIVAIEVSSVTLG
jgi:hypothetical protein